jgi:hypothetical protein
VSETFPAERMQGIAHDTVAAKLRLMRLMKGLGALPDIPIPPHPEE